ncbi:hypothetical protein IMZ11_12565 [Microtetraspora sp. AC03309]|uniref:hypothetical protein n=1 Tax=Microtetraspora sp. AC03309 TaxID=2779376 RepID=UPI001E535550|nr:hypothetical protein [Microtetraspora sp. AC03309]MCC5576465.1 hypothetical protein [Microtetraspora sp. AC03309]
MGRVTGQAGGAQLLGLPFLAQLPGENLTVPHEELTAFSTELNTLVAHWVETIHDDDHVDERDAGVPLLTNCSPGWTSCGRRYASPR